MALKNGDPNQDPLTQATPKASPTPAESASMLDGTVVATDLALRHPLGVMVENLSTIRPQTGLSTASVIYEAVVEGGITRFMAVYGPRLPEKIGPVRSARQVFVEISKEFTPVSAYYAHVGGSPDALATLKNEKLYDMDQFAVGGKAFERIAKAGLASEHTMYTYPDKLYTAAKDKGYSTQATFRPWLFKADAEVANRPEAQTIVIPFSGASYDVTYIYDKLTNSYKRQQLGSDFTDTLTGKALSPKNIVVQFATYAARKGDDKGRQDVNVTDGGTAKVLRDGIVTEAKWAKDKATNRTIFTDAASGTEIKFNAGQTIVEIVKSDAKVVVTSPSPSPTAVASP